jgi:hypothetical protein
VIKYSFWNFFLFNFWNHLFFFTFGFMNKLTLDLKFYFQISMEDWFWFCFCIWKEVSMSLCLWFPQYIDLKQFTCWYYLKLKLENLKKEKIINLKRIETTFNNINIQLKAMMVHHVLLMWKVHGFNPCSKWKKTTLLLNTLTNELIRLNCLTIWKLLVLFVWVPLGSLLLQWRFESWRCHYYNFNFHLKSFKFSFCLVLHS